MADPKVLIIDDYGEVLVLTSKCTDRWVLNREEWDGAGQLKRKEMAEGMEGCRELWPAWFRAEVDQLVAQWNSEVMEA